MFYNDLLLRKGGKFYICWLADFYPRRLNSRLNKQIWGTDLRNTCDELREVIISESGSASKKFSLRLSSHLICGLTRVYNRKLNLFLDYLCNLTARLDQETNLLYNKEDRPEPPARRKRRRVTAAPTVSVTANDVIDQIQGTNHMVVRLDDITIREENLPPIAVPNDGFGEELIPEVMRAPESSQHQISRLDLEVTDRSRDVTGILHLTGRMEILQEVDVFNAKKSTGGDLIMPFDLEKDIPQIPDIILPEIPNDPVVIREEIIPVEKQLERSADFDLESLEVISGAENLRRRKRTSLIVDQCTMYSGKYMRKRLESVHIEQRYATAKDSTFKLDKVLTYVLFRQPALGNHTRLRSVNYPRWCTELQELFVRNLIVSSTVNDPVRELETMLHHPRLNRISEEDEDLQPVPQVVEEPTKVVEGPTRVMEGVEETPRISEFDISAHQITTIAEVHKTMDEEFVSPLPKKRRLNSDKRLSSQEARKSPQMCKAQSPALLVSAPPPIGDIPIPTIVHSDQIVDIDVRENSTTRTSGDSNEPQLGSLDRTKVSVDTHNEDTDMNTYLREHWGSEAVFKKIVLFRRKDRDSPLDVKRLMDTITNRMAAAKCFSTLLKLYKHNLITLVKGEESSEIINILIRDKSLI